MNYLFLIFSVLAMSVSQASDKIKMYYSNEDLTKVIEHYSKASGQKFIVDSTVRGKITMYLQTPVSVEEAFNLLSSALALNGYAISKQGDTMIVRPARYVPL